MTYQTGKDNNKKLKIPRLQRKGEQRHTPLVRANWLHTQDNLEPKLKTILLRKLLRWCTKILGNIISSLI